MGARRQRFTSGERGAFTPGAVVEFLNTPRWVPATVTGGVEVDSLGGEFVSITVPSVPVAARGYPKGLRLVDRVGTYV